MERKGSPNQLGKSGNTSDRNVKEAQGDPSRKERDGKHPPSKSFRDLRDLKELLAKDRH